MASKEPIQNTTVVVEPKAKKKYKTKKEKEKDTTFEELATIGKVMIKKNKLCEEEAQSQRELVEKEAAMATPIKPIRRRQKGRMRPSYAKCWLKRRLFL
jgi:hypothetical protein